MSSLPNLSRMTPQELIALKAQISQIETDRSKAQADLRSLLEDTQAKLTRAMEAAGVSLPPTSVSQVTAKPVNGNGHRKPVKKSKGRRLPIKFRDPANPRHVWTGRGKTPEWITASGKDKSAFRISA